MMKITGYSDKISAVPGETIRFMVNSEAGKRYRTDIVRVICGDENPDDSVLQCISMGSKSASFGHSFSMVFDWCVTSRQDVSIST